MSWRDGGLSATARRSFLSLLTLAHGLTISLAIAMLVRRLLLSEYTWAMPRRQGHRFALCPTGGQARDLRRFRRLLLLRLQPRAVRAGRKKLGLRRALQQRPNAVSGGGSRASSRSSAGL